MNAIKQLWEHQQRFLLQIAGGVAGFLALMLIAGSYQSSVAEQRDQLVKGISDQQDRLNKLDVKGPREIAQKNSLSQQYESLLAAVAISRTAKIEVPATGGDLQFTKVLERCWSEFSDRADRIGLRYPALKDVVFDVGSHLTAEEWRDCYIQIDVLSRFLHAVVEQRVRQLVSVNPLAVTQEPLAEQKEQALLRHAVRVEIVCTYEQLLGLLQYFQQPGRFLGLEVESIANSGAGDSLKCELLLVGVDIDKRRETKAGGAPRRKSSRGRS